MAEFSKEYFAAKDRVKIRKHEGDHRSSWAMFVDGKMKFNGMDQREARGRKAIEIDRILKEGEKT